MSLRSKLVQQVSVLLTPGEQIQAVFLAANYPYNAAQGNLEYYTIVVTNRSILVLSRAAFSKTPSLLWRHRRDVYLGLTKRLGWASFVIDGTKYWVNWRFYKDVKAADAALHS